MLLFGISGFIFLKRKVLGNNAIFVYIWIFFSLFSAFFSQRPYTHYVLLSLPAVCLLIGLIFKKKFSLNLIFYFNLTIILLFTNFTYYIKTIYYYQNFIAFVTNQKTTYQYQRFFDGNTPNDYDLSKLYKYVYRKDDNIFIWGNNAQVYKLTNKLPPGRYTVAYHITSYKDGFENTEKGIKYHKSKIYYNNGKCSKLPFFII